METGPNYALDRMATEICGIKVIPTQFAGKNEGEQVIKQVVSGFWESVVQNPYPQPELALGFGGRLALTPDEDNADDSAADNEQEQEPSTQAPNRGVDKVPANGGKPRVKGAKRGRYGGTPCTTYKVDPAIIQNMSKAPNRGQEAFRVLQDIHFEVPQQKGTDKDFEEGNEYGSRPFLVKFEQCDCGGIEGLNGYRQCAGHTAATRSKVYLDSDGKAKIREIPDKPPVVLPVVEHLAVLGLSYTNGEDCRKWLPWL